jgi:hypothetical protein
MDGPANHSYVQWRGWMHRQAVRAGCEADDAHREQAAEEGKRHRRRLSILQKEMVGSENGQTARRMTIADGWGDNHSGNLSEFAQLSLRRDDEYAK